MVECDDQPALIDEAKGRIARRAKPAAFHFRHEPFAGLDVDGEAIDVAGLVEGAVYDDGQVLDNLRLSMSSLGSFSFISECRPTTKTRGNDAPSSL